jgi:DNA-binding XRE family transcriptional regulator
LEYDYITQYTALLMAPSFHLVKVYREKAKISKVRLAKMSELTPRIIHMIESDPNYNPSRRTMLRISNSLGLPPSVIFFPEEEVEKRQMLSNIMLFCMQNIGLSEEKFMALLRLPPALIPLTDEPLPAASSVEMPAAYAE